MSCFCAMTKFIILFENPFILSKLFRNVINMIDYEVLITFDIHATFDNEIFDLYCQPKDAQIMTPLPPSCLWKTEWQKVISTRVQFLSQFSKPYALEKNQVFSLCVGVRSWLLFSKNKFAWKFYQLSYFLTCLLIANVNYWVNLY